MKPDFSSIFLSIKTIMRIIIIILKRGDGVENLLFIPDVCLIWK